MSRLAKIPLLSVALVSVLLTGLLGGAAIAQTAGWQKPGDDVNNLTDAQAAINFWNLLPISDDPSQAGMWLAFGEMVDNMMELDIRTRGPGGYGERIDALESQISDLRATIPGVLGFYTVTGPLSQTSTGSGQNLFSGAVCDAGDSVTGGGLSVSMFGGLSDGSPRAASSFPDVFGDPGGPANRWRVSAVSIEAGWAVSAEAICADMTP